MPQAGPEAPFPTWRAGVWLTAVALAAGAVAALIARAWTGAVDAAHAAVFSAVVTWAAAILGLIPVAKAGPQGVDATVRAYFIGMAGRLLLCLGAGAVGVYILALRADALLLSLAATYLPLLFVEAALVGRYVWLKDPRPSAPADGADPSGASGGGGGGSSGGGDGSEANAKCI